MSFLNLTNVCKSYARPEGEIRVLKDVNLQIEQGEFVAIVGYSGSGKTTLISLIAGLIKPTAGSIELNGLEITRPGPDRGIVFQNYSLLPWLTVYENIHMAVDRVFPNWPQARKEEHTRKYISMVNLTPAAQKRPTELSGGMRQRVSVARALSIDPQILLLDEPLSALDALTRATLQDEIGRICLKANKTVVLITNDADEAILLADRIIPLSAGPQATLGPSVMVDIPRPRDRRQLNHHPRFREIRQELYAYLQNSQAKSPRSSRALILPDLEPQDLTIRRTFFGRTATPVKASAKKPEATVLRS